MTEPYRDPDGPIHAVLAAADAAEPRVRLVGDGALIHSRYEAPTGRCGEAATRNGAAERKVQPDRQRTWWERLTNQPLTRDDYMAVEGP